MIRYYCPHCGSGLNAPERLANKNITCAVCGEKATVPPANHQRRGLPVTRQDRHHAQQLKINTGTGLPLRYPIAPRLSAKPQHPHRSPVHTMNELTHAEENKNEQFDQLILLSGAGHIKPTEFKALARRIESGERVVFQD